jgi:molybdopterin synthase catalytic subunit
VAEPRVFVQSAPHIIVQSAARIIVQSEAIDLGHEYAALCGGRTDIGGVGSFIGVVRETAGGRPITAMTLEHYPGMTERALSEIAEGAMQRWDLQGVTVIHRVGEMQPGEMIVLVLTASPHRHAALEACAYLIDWLKTKAPFWKKERFADGSEAWVDARESDDVAAARWGVG